MINVNKNGFTLIELLGVIIILSFLALITTTSITKTVKDSKEELYNTQINSIKSAAEYWGSSNLNKLPGDGECKYLTLSDLKEYSILEESIVNPKTDEEFPNDLKIKITSKYNVSGILISSYEVEPESVKGCIPVYNK